MPDWVKSIWMKMVGAIAIGLVGSAFSGVGAAYLFVTGTNTRLAVLETEMKEALSKLDARVAENSTVSHRHSVELAKVEKKQDEIFGKEVPAPTAVPK